MSLFKNKQAEKTMYEQLIDKFQEDTEYYQRQIQSLEEEKRKLKGGEQMAFKPVKTEPIEAKKQEVKEEPKEIYEVVDKLPVQEIRKYKREDGVIVNLITVAEALTGMINDKE